MLCGKEMASSRQLRVGTKASVTEIAMDNVFQAQQGEL